MTEQTKISGLDGTVTFDQVSATRIITGQQMSTNERKEGSLLRIMRKFKIQNFKYLDGTEGSDS